MSKALGLRTALQVNGVYTVIVGLLLFFPPLAASVFAYPVKDAAVTSGWGVGLITLGIVILATASDVERYGGLAWVFIVGLLLSAIDLISFWTTGAYNARNVLLPIIINVVMAAWIWSARSKR